MFRYVDIYIFVFLCFCELFQICDIIMNFWEFSGKK